jgi:uncharacterized protein (DUF2062 family)
MQAYSNLIGLSILLPSMQRNFSTRFVSAERLQAAQARAQERVLEWLTTGLQPRQLAFTLALGFAIGCIPVLGVTTGICALLAVLLRLNMPAIQAANWLAMPFQVVLLIPFLKLGAWLFPGQAMTLMNLDRGRILSQATSAPWNTMVQMGGMFGHALLAWLLTAAPALLLMTLLLTPVLHLVARRATVPAE